MNILISTFFPYFLLLPFLGLLMLGIALTHVQPHTPRTLLLLSAIRKLCLLVLVRAGEEEGEKEVAGGRREGSFQQPDHIIYNCGVTHWRSSK